MPVKNPYAAVPSLLVRPGLKTRRSRAPDKILSEDQIMEWKDLAMLIRADSTAAFGSPPPVDFTAAVVEEKYVVATKAGVAARVNAQILDPLCRLFEANKCTLRFADRATGQDAIKGFEPDCTLQITAEDGKCKAPGEFKTPWSTDLFIPDPDDKRRFLGVYIWLLGYPPQSMCHSTCDADNSPRQKWFEIATQVLYAHNYLPGLMAAICRSLDMYLWGRWRLGGSLRTRQRAFATLAWIHDCWFRLDDQASSIASDLVDVDEEKQQQQQVEKEREALVPRAPPTPMYKLDLVVWSYILGSVLNVGLAVCMWELNRSTDPTGSQAIWHFLRAS
ncbi:hypothetical protein ASPACDRAFT_48108 [Aspergillus aculeatus ATCC 16872]|uniref:Uncharacterized protein n=1 Tax=Aspergillus aculeatus (strain ATCC 16872 / CBS 172.66 / WB 5094) TaxID=690307 RepID=A0A1L9WGR5_ASPA1|nr:uncharacterized protein ASPACDRAFT_48108 [Aspergillus aculeatus ATCC 16872]OJJ95359.1 hypothetical protein ASPACDRAFT_48108 [Aspergillus aculeatus ATCC 16872]